MQGVAEGGDTLTGFAPRLESDDDDSTLIVQPVTRNQAGAVATAAPSRLNAGQNCRLFVVCNKTASQEVIKRHFLPYGTVTQVFMIKDKLTKMNKGCAFVTFEHASSALRALEAIQEMLPNLANKPLKAYLAHNPDDTIQNTSGAPSRHPSYLDKLSKVRIHIRPEDTEDSLGQIFKEFGKLDYVNIYGDRSSALLKFQKASHAATAVERCDRCYNAILSINIETVAPEVSSGPFSKNNNVTQCKMDSTSAPLTSEQSMMAAAILGLPHRELEVRYDSLLSEANLFSLFDIVPGLEKITLGKKISRSTGVCYPVFKTPLNALYAREKLNGFEYPLGSFLTVSFRAQIKVKDGVITSSRDTLNSRSSDASTCVQQMNATDNDEKSNESSSDDAVDKNQSDDDEDDEEESSGKEEESSTHEVKAQDVTVEDVEKKPQQKVESSTEFESTSTVFSTDACGMSRMDRNLDLLNRQKKVKKTKSKKRQRSKKQETTTEDSTSSDSEVDSSLQNATVDNLPVVRGNSEAEVDSNEDD